MTSEPTPARTTQPWIWVLIAVLVLAAVVAVILLASNSSSDDAAATSTTAASGVTTTAGSGGSTTTAPGGGESATVVKLQSGLSALGYYTGPIDGLYGPATTEAVKALQTDLGVEPVDGLYGPATHEALSEALGGDPASEIVGALQAELKNLGYYDGPVDGVYGPATVEGVKKLQAECGLTQDGIYGPSTHDCLINLGDNAGA